MDWRTRLAAMPLGTEVLVALAVGWRGGVWLDGELGTAPWLTAFGIVAGLGAVIKALVRVTRAYQREGGDDEPGDDPRRGSKQP